MTKLRLPSLSGPVAYLGRFARRSILRAGHNTNGVSAQSRAAIRKLDEEAAPKPAPAAADFSRARGGPSPSKELLERVETQRQQRGEESFRRMMEKRRREAAK